MHRASLLTALALLHSAVAQETEDEAAARFERVAMWVGITVIIITVLTITFFCINFGCGGSDSMDAGTGCCDTVISWVIDRTVGCTQSKISSVTVVLALLVAFSGLWITCIIGMAVSPVMNWSSPCVKDLGSFEVADHCPVCAYTGQPAPCSGNGGGDGYEQPTGCNSGLADRLYWMKWVGVFPLIILLCADTIVQLGSLIAAIYEFLYQKGDPVFDRERKLIIVLILAAIKLIFAGFMAPFSMVIYQDCCCPMSAIDGVSIDTLSAMFEVIAFCLVIMWITLLVGVACFCFAYCFMEDEAEDCASLIAHCGAFAEAMTLAVVIGTSVAMGLVYFGCAIAFQFDIPISSILYIVYMISVCSAGVINNTAEVVSGAVTRNSAFGF